MDVQRVKVRKQYPAEGGKNGAGHLCKISAGKLVGQAVICVFGKAFAFFGGSIVNQCKKQGEENNENKGAALNDDIKDNCCDRITSFTEITNGVCKYKGYQRTEKSQNKSEGI